MREKVDFNSVKDKEVFNRKKPTCPKDEYLAYENTEDLVPPMADFGSGYRYHVTGLAHDEFGFPSNDSQIADTQIRRLMEKVEKNKEDIIKYEEYKMDDAEVVFIAFGSTSRTAKETVENLRSEGVKAGLFRPITIWPFAEDKVKEISEKIEIKKLLNQSAFTLSGGEKQKVSIARALITEPEILFVDEATTNLDEESIQFFNSHFADLVTDEMTVVMVSHDRRQIKLLADYITLLHKGKVKISREINEFKFQLFGEGIETPIAELV